jgi:two-component system response regulator NreC
MNDNIEQPDRIKIMLVDDHNVVREGLKLIIDAQPDMVVVAEAGDGESAIRIAKEMRIDVIISDLSMPNVDGFGLFEHLASEHPEVKIIAFSMLTDQKTVEKALQLGCSGFVTKFVGAEELIFGIKQVVKGKIYLCSHILKEMTRGIKAGGSMIPNKIPIDLSDRELKVLEYISNGMTTVEIAKEVFLSRRTVEGHRQTLLDKTKSKNTAVLIKYAVINGLVK